MAIDSEDYLVVLDYGMGGLWAVVRAESKDQIGELYPELKVVEHRPVWMDDTEYESLRADELSIDAAPRGLLKDIIDARSHP